jgi:hypothetical protein
MELKTHVQHSHSLWKIWEQSLIITRFSHLNDILKTKIETKISKFISWKGFGEYIWHLILSIKINHVNFILLEEFSMHVKLEINVLCALIKFMIYHQMHDKLSMPFHVTWKDTFASSSHEKLCEKSSIDHPIYPFIWAPCYFALLVTMTNFIFFEHNNYVVINFFF